MRRTGLGAYDEAARRRQEELLARYAARGDVSSAVPWEARLDLALTLEGDDNQATFREAYGLWTAGTPT